MVAWLCLGSMPIAASAALDRNGDGISDVWASLYPNIGVPSADPDGDGQNNLAEAQASTDPTSASSHLDNTVERDAGGNLAVRWPSVTGKHYYIETSGDLHNWTPLAGDYAGTGGELVAIVRTAGTATDARAFWHLVAFDVDSDGNGLNNWEETHLNMVAAITATAGANGTISPSGNVYVTKGGSLGFTIAPAMGYEIGQLSVDGQGTSPALVYTFSNIQAAHSIGVTFKPVSTLSVNPTSLNLAAGNSATVAVSSNATWSAASNQTWLTVTPLSGTGNGTLAVAAAANTGTSARNATITVAGPAGSGLVQTVTVTQESGQGGPAANFDPATLAMLTTNTGLTAEQWNNIMKLVNKPEQDNLNWVNYYGYCDNINDGRGYTIGIFGATTGGPNDDGPDGPALFKEYDKVCGAANPSTAGGLARIGIQGSMSGAILNITESKTAFKAHIKGLQNVANWRTAMWNTFYSVYIQYCVQQMQARSFTTALTLGSFVDCALNQGATGDSGTLSGMLSKTGNISGETAFMTQFYKVRTAVVDTNEYNQPPNGTNRVKEWSNLLSLGETDLLNCDAQVISVTNWIMQ